MECKVSADKSKEFKVSAYTNQSKLSWEPQKGGLIFEFGNTKVKDTPEEPKPHSSGHKFVFGKA